MDQLLGDLPATITALATLVAAFGALFISWRNVRKTDDVKARAHEAADSARLAREEAAASKKEIIRVGEDVFELGKRVDGRLSELLAAATNLARAEGITQGEQSQRDRDSVSPEVATNGGTKP